MSGNNNIVSTKLSVCSGTWDHKIQLSVLLSNLFCKDRTLLAQWMRMQFAQLISYVELSTAWLNRVVSKTLPLQLLSCPNQVQQTSNAVSNVHLYQTHISIPVTCHDLLKMLQYKDVCMDCCLDLCIYTEPRCIVSHMGSRALRLWMKQE